MKFADASQNSISAALFIHFLVWEEKVFAVDIDNYHILALYAISLT